MIPTLLYTSHAHMSCSVKFIKDLANGVGFAPANILLVREEVGMLRTEDGASCAVLEMKTTAATGQY